MELASDAEPLAATKIEVQGGGEEVVEIKVPLQAVDTTAKTVTVLGLTVDVSSATLEGTDDEDTAGDDAPVDPGGLRQWAVGPGEVTK